MVLLKNIVLKDFLSHKNSALAIREDSRLLVDGVSGAGKSSVVDALVWCLYGVSRADGRSVVRKGRNEAVVEVTLKDDDDLYVIERKMTNKGKHTLSVFSFVNGERVPHELTGKKELQLWIEKDLLGASYLLFVNSVVHLQEGADLFVLQTAQKRKELLLEIIKTEDYDALYEKARDTLAKYRQEEASLLASAEEKKSFIEMVRPPDGKEGLLKKEVKESVDSLKRLEKEVKEMEKHSEEEAKRRGELSLLSMELMGHKQNLSTLNTSLEDSLIARERLEKMATLDGEMASLEARIKSLQRYLEILDKRPSSSGNVEVLLKEGKMVKDQLEHLSHAEKCPSGGACPYVKKNTENVLSLAARLTEIEKEVEEERSSFVEWERGCEICAEGMLKVDLESPRSALNLLNDTRLSLSQKLALKETLEAQAGRAPSIQADISTTEWAIADTERKIKELSGQESLVDEVRLNETKTKIAFYHGRVGSLEKELDAIEENRQRVKKLQEEVALIEKGRIPTIQAEKEKVLLAKEALGGNGIRSIAIDYILPKLEENINSLLSKMSDFEVRLDTQAPKTSGDGMKEGLFITIRNDVGEELPYENYSGGEKLKITVAIAEALGGLQKVGFRVFDELFIGLDQDSTEAFASVLERMQERFPQVVCISHLQEIKDLFDEKLTCVKINGVTKII